MAFLGGNKITQKTLTPIIIKRFYRFKDKFGLLNIEEVVEAQEGFKNKIIIGSIFASILAGFFTAYNKKFGFHRTENDYYVRNFPLSLIDEEFHNQLSKEYKQIEPLNKPPSQFKKFCPIVYIKPLFYHLLGGKFQLIHERNKILYGITSPNKNN
eukprot:TRINITY_DN3104_c0_g1_i1.p1 TRINITY_DN3104_c0_g1~~TRINITY_DN3104_c0_g1_i1.p1  ORF type:complete len:155 (-),score=63.21 TRINITY_DN3104_c0_g1_i1:100-564(-)